MDLNNGLDVRVCSISTSVKFLSFAKVMFRPSSFSKTMSSVLKANETRRSNLDA